MMARLMSVIITIMMEIINCHVMRGTWDVMAVLNLLSYIAGMQTMILRYGKTTARMAWLTSMNSYMTPTENLQTINIDDGNDGIVDQITSLTWQANGFLNENYYNTTTGDGFESQPTIWYETYNMIHHLISVTDDEDADGSVSAGDDINKFYYDTDGNLIRVEFDNGYNDFRSPFYHHPQVP
jgi:hypothetical protein